MAKTGTAIRENTSQSGNSTLAVARSARKDEFYTRYVDIEKEVEAYLEFDPETFRGKVVYCNCDDPFESDFFKYFASNFKRLGLKKLVTTSYDGSPIAGQGTLFPEYNEGNGKRKKPKALAVCLESVQDEDGDGAANIVDVEIFLRRNKASRKPLQGDEKYPGGDFRSKECVELLETADIVVTNPPFSLFREYVTQLIEHKKKFLIIGPKNAISYKEIFPLIRDTKLWLGVGFTNGNAFFSIPPEGARVFAAGVYDEVSGLVKFRNVGWFTNMDHGRRHERLPLMTVADNLRFSKHKEINGRAAYARYDNYDAIDVPFTDAIPSDYEGIMGVPITFLDKFNPDQFEIIGITQSWDGLASKVYPKQVQVGKDGKRSEVTKLNDGAATRVHVPPVGKTYYIVGKKLFTKSYCRVLIRHRSRRPAGGRK